MSVYTTQMDVHTSAYQVIDKTVKSIGNSGGVLGTEEMGWEESEDPVIGRGCRRRVR